MKGIGPRIAETLNQRGIRTVEDLLYHLPFRYEDRLHPRTLTDLKAGETSSVIAEVRGAILLRTKRMPIFELTVGQGIQTMKCVWFHGSYLQDRFRPGQMVSLYGKVEVSRSRTGQMKMIQPQFEILPSAGDIEDAESALLESKRIVPVYPTLGGPKLGARWIRRVVFGALQELGANVPESLPPALLESAAVPPRAQALRGVHFPEEETPLSELNSAATPEHKRVIFEELFYLELGLELKRRKMRERPGISFATADNVRKAIKQMLPFHPTAAQKRVLGEIVEDMRTPAPMRRLLQGDVGSGKTIVALQAALVAIENGYQAALMAPTEILATQHFLGARKLLERSKYHIALLTGSLDEDRKRRTRGQIMRGEAQLVIGTHALIEEKVEFDKLGLVIVDEQHRFGVVQRFRLMKKPNALEPDVLVMTATPIPRTLALTLYGDMDISVLDELPPGRTPIVTRQVSDTREQEIWEFVQQEVALGHQAYVVYPVIEGNPSDEPELDFAAETAAESDAKTAGKTGAKKTAGRPGNRRDEDSEAAASAAFALKAPAAKVAKVAGKKTSGPKSNLKSAMERYEHLRNGPLKGLKVGLLHGRLDADTKEITMRRFQRGEIDVLVSTTVIEVGVDVPNATMMVIEHAERFGLAQLHQLRGRVGRGAAQSHCILMTGGKSSLEAEERLAAMVRTQNGFELAELDLELRGPGEFFGTKQAGVPEFRVANLLRDRKLLELAKAEAAAFVTAPHSRMSREEASAIMAHLREHWQRRYGLVEA